MRRRNLRVMITVINQSRVHLRVTQRKLSGFQKWRSPSVCNGKHCHYHTQIQKCKNTKIQKYKNPQIQKRKKKKKKKKKKLKEKIYTNTDTEKKKLCRSSYVCNRIYCHCQLIRGSDFLSKYLDNPEQTSPFSLFCKI